MVWRWGDQGRHEGRGPYCAVVMRDGAAAWALWRVACPGAERGGKPVPGLTALVDGRTTKLVLDKCGAWTSSCSRDAGGVLHRDSVWSWREQDR